MSKTADRVRELIANEMGLDEYPALEADIQTDIGADSLDVVEIVMALEEEFHLDIPDRDAEGLHTVKDVVAYIERETA